MRRARIGILISITITAFFVFAPLRMVESRPGGGSSFHSSHSSGSSHSSHSSFHSSSSHSSSSSSSSSSSGDNIVWLLIQLVFAYPKIGFPAIAILFILYYLSNRKKPGKMVSSISEGKAEDLSTPRGPSINRGLDEGIARFREVDSDFSRVVFLDFVNLLFHQVKEARGKPALKNLAPYIEPGLMARLSDPALGNFSVDEIVIGTMNIENLQSDGVYDRIQVYIESNFTEYPLTNGTILPGTKGKRYISEERWTFRRKMGVLSGGPKTELSCPNCGAGLSLNEFGVCKYCKTPVEPGNLAWELFTVKGLYLEETGAWSFGEEVEEEGTNLPTLFSPHLTEEKQAFIQRNGLSDFESYGRTFEEKIARPVFQTVYDSWSTRNWVKARPVMSDRLFDSHYFSIKEYEERRAFNKLDDLKLNKVEVVRLDSDKYYESITARMHASVLDYTVDEAGKLLGGSNKKPRKFTEYWTFIRRAGVEKKEEDFHADQCPNCGAPIKMGMTGVCEYCKSRVTTGEFNWVLTSIVQDEVYRQ